MDGEYITITEASKLFPKVNGRRISNKAIIRRIVKGVGEVKLEAITDGYRYLTKKEWVTNFLREVNSRKIPETGARQAVKAGREAMERLRSLYGNSIMHGGRKRPPESKGTHK